MFYGRKRIVAKRKKSVRRNEQRSDREIRGRMGELSIRGRIGEFSMDAIIRQLDDEAGYRVTQHILDVIDAYYAELKRRKAAESELSRVLFVPTIVVLCCAVPNIILLLGALGGDLNRFYAGAIVLDLDLLLLAFFSVRLVRIFARSARDVSPV